MILYKLKKSILVLTIIILSTYVCGFPLYAQQENKQYVNEQTVQSLVRYSNAKNVKKANKLFHPILRMLGSKAMIKNHFLANIEHFGEMHMQPIRTQTKRRLIVPIV